MADLVRQIDCLSSQDVAETVAFAASVPRHVNLTEITILPTEQAIRILPPTVTATQNDGDRGCEAPGETAPVPTRVREWPRTRPALARV